MRYFLVDFENVSDSGLKGFFSLRNEDQVVLFYTLKANRVSMEFFEAVMTRPHCGSLRFLQVSAGNQALDLQLASYLGSLVAAGERDCEYYIISKDKGFQCLVSFWEKQGRSIRLRQFGSIAEALSQRWPEPQNAPQPAQAEKPAPQQQCAPQPEKQEPEQPEPKQAVQPVPQPEPAPQTAEPAPAPEPEKPEPEKDAPQKPQPEPTQPEPEKPQPPALPVPAPPKALAVQNAEKQEPKPQPKQEPQPEQKPNGQNKNQKNQPNEKTLLNTRVQQALSKAKYDTAIISHVASLVAKTFGKPKVRQLVYLDLIKEYGQKKGLEIYQLVKTML